MTGSELLRRARREAGLSQEALARRAGTSRATVSAYEHGHKSPTLATTERLLTAIGRQLIATSVVGFDEKPLVRGRTAYIPSELPRLAPAAAFAQVSLPLRLNWSQPRRVFDLADRGDRARVYEAVLTEGGPADVLEYVDGALLIDLWHDLVLPWDVQAAWAPVVASALSPAS